ncbi:phosphatidylglycerophosphatase B [Erwinia tracheiphila]|uniref:undecaprenyl-diphosphate phosphatase n=1 Tax=Erwinia tracheiphila TaxID=65700 RepID=A0A0M2KBB3_9GAMM|nr:phosphatidylglycerophosphatase B [Erwinia tracheiphila]AXF75789.1 phosphatidylglycerophosphatase B [Erwinia tracheiphila]EOS93331.1 phosphatidylglycerophosphatase B [Erwinia tracheiphila PSU-1]KKF34567.1 phosphatidylglycerophosphatase [Erwinia tracheiphila]UIA85563.1 phosphatidylglycerophosphatase B [Erwinia tracheiphila]UIA86239.1 phosphatidylglycerophosphatase B [Erwinia tracheiphila]
MFDILIRTTSGALVLLIMPIIVWLSGWQWQPGTVGPWQRILFGVTETVSSPWGTVTSGLFCVWFIWCLRLRLKPGLVLLIIMILAIASGQYVTTVIKEHVQEPRPYVIWLEKNHLLEEKSFYQKNRQERSELVERGVANENRIPAWLKSHWAFETDYAFPSGHTMFAASWALLAVSLLWPRRRTVTVVLIFMWAIGVMGSRLVLGMHWPRDLVASTLIGWFLITLAMWLVQKWRVPLRVESTDQKKFEKRKKG